MNKIGKRTILLLMALPMVINVMAQEMKKLTLDDLIPGGETYRYAENLYALQWWGDECIKPGMDTIYTIQPQTGKETMLVTREQINKVLEANKLGKLSHLYSVSFPWADKSQLLLTLPGKYVVYDFKTDQLVSSLKLKEKASNQDYCAANGKVAYTIGNNLYVNDQAVTDEPEGIVCGQSVHRNEFGIEKGTFWSPKGNLLAFYRMDESMVTQYPLVDITARVGEVNNIRYPMAGMTSHKVKVGIYNPETGKSIYLNAGDPTDRYFTNISWAPDEKSLYLIELNRDQNHAKLCQYNAETGDLVKILFEESHPKYVEPQHPITFLPWDDSKFIYQSQKDGFNHLYLYNTEGKLLKQLTKGNWLVSELLGFNTKKKEVIFTAIEGLKSGHFAVNVSNGKMNQPFDTCKESQHNGILNASGTYLIDFSSAINKARTIDLVDTKNFKSINLLQSKNPYEGYQMPTLETGTIKAADGTTDLYYRLMKPADFDPNKKYPVIVYVYGGPHAQCVTGGWLNGARGWDIYMANKGYIMFTIDNRGSSNRGLEFENATFRHLGIEEGKDQVKGIEYLKSLPYVDGNRIGVHGWSFGGHMTTALLLRYPEIFKVGVAGGPVIDWGYYEIMYGERYMDTPQSNPEGYKECNLRNLAGQLKGRLLIIHDDHDDTCVPQHTLSFMKACVDARTYPDLFIYPCHKHNVSGRDRVHLHEKITRYFEEHL
ncbi:S9 family peptidase [Bacteroides bouchesdurhonensis]|uniref:S9 family peptidase n=1 Tax=Bacteroides bouchesdurhonensis TaxID=1841855 RepID=UPI0011DC9DBA|nr:S9 family peptidase [Bacteroides bouchesdurhonensis]